MYWCLSVRGDLYLTGAAPHTKWDEHSSPEGDSEPDWDTTLLMQQIIVKVQPEGKIQDKTKQNFGIQIY